MKHLPTHILFRKLSIIILIIGYLSFPARATEAIDKEKWAKISKDVSYIEDYKEREVNNKPKELENRNFSWLKNLFDFSNVDFTALKVTFYVIIISVLVFLLYLLLLRMGFLKGGSARRKKIKHITLDNFEEHVEEADLEYLLKTALAEKKYFLALRIQYLIVLQSLNEAKLIVWKKDKTNGAYLCEMLGNTSYNDFSHLTYVFEKVWYGEIDITAHDYKLLSVHYQMFNKKIRGNETK